MRPDHPNPAGPPRDLRSAPAPAGQEDLALDLARLAPAELAAHVRAALATPSGQVLREFLRTHCFMRPGPRTEPWEGEARLAFRYGRMTLFQLLEFTGDPRNFPEAARPEA